MATTPNYDLDIDTTLGGNNASDYVIPSQKAIKDYVDNHSGGGGTSTDVQINGTSITSGGVADILTNTAYDSTTNKIATMSDLPTVPTNVSSFTNDSGYITGITSSDVTTALGYTPYNSSNPSGYQANVIETVKVNNTALTPTSKAVNITVPTTASDVNALPDTTKYGATIDVTLSTTDYKQTIALKDQDGNTLSSKVVDFPIESVVVGGAYDSTNKEIVLTLQNGNTIDVPVGDLVAGLQTEITSSNKLSADLISDGTTNKTVTATEKNTWNGKQNAISDLSTIRSGASAGATAVQPDDLATVATSGNYNDLTNKPTVNNATLTIQKNGTTVKTFTANASSNVTANITVPTKTSELTNDSGYTSNVGTVTKVNNTSPDANGNVTISIPTVPLEGVQINGTDLTITNKKVNIPLAGTDTIGVAKTNAAYGISISDGTLTTLKASNAQITTKTNQYRPLTPYNVDLVVKTGITTNTITLTDAEKSTACDWIGAEEKLVSGTNIKTINGNSLLGSGNIEIQGGTDVDSTLSTTSTNPVQNKVITTELNKKIEGISSNDVTTALGYTPANTTLSNLGATSSTNFDGQWVGKYLRIENSTSIDSYSHSLSNYLPDSTNKYEILVEISLSYNSANAGFCVGTVASPDTNKDTNGNFFINSYVTSASKYQYVQGIIPIGTGRTLYSQVATGKPAAALITLTGYRRIGTNS